jgi:hypothetical protein
MTAMSKNTTPISQAVTRSITAAALCVMLATLLTGCGLRGGNNNQPPAPPTNAPSQPQPAQPQQPSLAPPSAVPAEPTQASTQAVQPTEAVQPTAAPATETAQSDPQGDEIDQLLNQLDRENQSADPLNDVPQ